MFSLFLFFCSVLISVNKRLPFVCPSGSSRHATTHSRLLAHFQIKRIVRRHTHVTTDIQHSRQQQIRMALPSSLFPPRSSTTLPIVKFVVVDLLFSNDIDPFVLPSTNLQGTSYFFKSRVLFSFSFSFPLKNKII